MAGPARPQALGQGGPHAPIRSSQGYSTVPNDIDCSCPLPQASTISPGWANLTPRRMRVAAVGHAVEVSALRRPPWRCGAGGHHRQDGIQRLGARVFGGQDRDVGQLAEVSAIMRRFSTSRSPAEPKMAITRPAAPAGCIWRGGLQGAAQRVGRVGKVHDGREILAQIDALHAAGHTRQSGDAAADRLGRQAAARPLWPPRRPGNWRRYRRPTRR